MADSDLKIRCEVYGVENIKGLEASIKATRDSFKTLAAGSDDFNAAGKRLSDQMSLKSELMKGAQSDNAKTMSSYFQLGESIRGVEQALMIAAAAYASLRMAQEMAETAARAEMLRQELTMLGQEKNFNATELINQMSDACGGSITQIDLMQIALRAVRLGNIDLEKMPLIMKQLEYESKLAGVSTREMFDTFIRGAETGSKKFQVQFGLLYDVKKAQEEYADSIGTTVKNLDDEEKRSINVKLAFDALISRHHALGGEAEGTLERFERLNVVWEKVKTTLGTLIGIPLSKFLLSVGLEAVIVADAVSSLYHTTLALVDVAIGAWKYAIGDKVGAMTWANAAEKQFDSVRKAGDDIRAQFKEIGNMWLDIQHKAGEGGKIGGAPITPPVHKSTLDEENKLLDKQLTSLKLKHEAGALTDEDYAKELRALQLLTKTDDEFYKIQAMLVQLSKESAKQIIKDTKDKDKEDAAYAKHMSERHKQAGVERQKVQKAVDQYIGSSSKALFAGIDGGFSSMTNQMSSAWQGMWARNIGNAQTMVAMMIQSIVDQFLAMAARMAALQIFKFIFPTSWASLLGLASGGDVTTGGSLRFAASGANFRYGGLQNVIVGEQGAELMQVGRNGVRIISNNNLQKMNQMGQASRGGGSGVIVSIQRVDSRIQGTDIVQSYILTQQGRKGRKG